MTHNLTVTPEQMQAIADGKRHIITKHKTTYATNDRLVIQVEGHWEEIEARITEIETERLYGGWCCLSLKVVQVDDVAKVALSGAVQMGNEAILGQMNTVDLSKIGF